MKTLAKRLSLSLFFCAGSVYADGAIPVDPSKTQVINIPGAPTHVDIAPPDPWGVSLNRFKEFNVSKNGMKFNNIAEWWNINKNPNFQGKAADIIIAEVTEMKASQLDGMMRVLGQKAQLIIANPWGINCNGCGFDNVSWGILLTGVPQFVNGKLDHYYVGDSAGGKVVIQEKGLNWTGADYLTIITRSLELQGSIDRDGSKFNPKHKSNYILGTNKVDLEGNIFFLQRENAPPLALDVGVFGAMYGHTKIISTEEGVGVKFAGKLNSGVAIDDNGNVIANNGKGNVIANNGKDVEMRLRGPLEFSGIAELANLAVKPVSPADNKVNVNHTGFIQTSNTVEMVANEITSKGTIGTGRLMIDAKKLEHNGPISLKADSVINVSHEFTGTGKIQSEGKIDLRVPEGFDNGQGMISANPLNIIPIPKEPPIQVEQPAA